MKVLILQFTYRLVSSGIHSLGGWFIPRQFEHNIFGRIKIF